MVTIKMKSLMIKVGFVFVIIAIMVQRSHQANMSYCNTIFLLNVIELNSLRLINLIF
jgi:hypothetical protein